MHREVAVLVLLPALLAALELNVRLAENLPVDHCHQALDQLQSLFTSTSERLDSLSAQLHLSRVIFHLPPAWDNHPCSSLPTTTPTLTTSQPDIDVGLHPMDRPSVEQYGGCGSRGRALLMPYHLLMKNITEYIEEQLFESLLAYEFGLFSNTGSGNGTRYPAEYTIGTKHFPNQGCKHGNNLCDSDDYNRDAPTQQNLLCHSLSWHEVIQAGLPNTTSTNSSSNNNSTMLNNGTTAPEFLIRRRVANRYILVLERGGPMATANRWVNLHNALHRFISELPAGDEVAIVTYEEKARTNLEPTVVTELNRAGIHGKIPGRVGPETARPCLACALRQARQLAAIPGGERHPMIILVATSASKDDSKIEEGTSSSSVDTAVLTYSSSSRGLFPFANQVLVVDEPLDSVDDVAVLLTSLLRVQQANRLQFHRTRLVLGAAERASGKFVVEDALRRDLFVVASTQHKEDVESFELTSPSGHQHRFPVVEKGVLYFTSGGLSEAGVWSFNLRIAPSTTSSPSSASSAVVVSAYAAKTATTNAAKEVASGGDTIALDVWADGDYPNLRLYALLTSGYLPISNASVRVTVSGGGGDEENSSVFAPVDIILEDSGNGYPDVTAGDGIYSAYVTGMAARPAGFYSLTFQGDDAKGQARVVAATAAAGMNNQLEATTAIPTPAFTRFARSSFYLSQETKIFIRDGRPQPEDLQPPSRVTDLRVAASTVGSLQVNLEWTAPGGDHTNGQAARYELRCYTNRAALEEERFAVTGLPVPANLLPDPAVAGSLQSATVGLPWHNELFYYGLVAFDSAGQRSPISNLVPVFVDEAPLVVNQTLSVASQTAGSLLARSSLMFPSGADDNIVYIVAGSLTGLALIAICLSVAFVCRRRRKELTDSRESLDYVKEFALGGSTLLPASKYALPVYTPPLAVKSCSSPSDYSQDSVFLSQKEELETAASLYTTYQNLHLHHQQLSLSPPPPPASDSSSDGALSSTDSQRYMLESARPWDHQHGAALQLGGEVDSHSWQSDAAAVAAAVNTTDSYIGSSDGGHHGGHQAAGWQQLDPALAARTWSERHRSSSSMRSNDMDHVDFRDKRRRRESFV